MDKLHSLFRAGKKYDPLVLLFFVLPLVLYRNGPVLSRTPFLEGGRLFLSFEEGRRKEGDEETSVLLPLVGNVPSWTVEQDRESDWNSDLLREGGRRVEEETHPRPLLKGEEETRDPLSCPLPLWWGEGKRGERGTGWVGTGCVEGVWIGGMDSEHVPELRPVQCAGEGGEDQLRDGRVFEKHPLLSFPVSSLHKRGGKRGTRGLARRCQDLLLQEEANILRDRHPKHAYQSKGHEGMEG